MITETAGWSRGLMNLYGFAGGDPVNLSDPFGLNPCLLPPVARACYAVLTGAATAATAAFSHFLQSRRQGEILDKIHESLVQVQDRLSRIGNLGPDDEDPDGKRRDWAKQARKHLNNAAEKWEKLKGKTREEMKQKLDTFRGQIDKILQ